MTARPRRLAIVTGLAVASRVVAAQQIPPSIEFRVAKAPTVAVGDSGGFVAYELHVTNLTPNPMRLDRVEVLNAGRGQGNHVLIALADSALLRALARPGIAQRPAEPATIGGGLRAYVYLWIPVDASKPPSAISHRLTLRRIGGDSAVSVLEGTTVPIEPRAVTIGPPLRGEWLNLNGPSNSSGHRRLILALNGMVASGQRFAMDLLQVDQSGNRYTGDRLKNESYMAEGQEVLAVADGIVVETKDSIPENVPGGRAVPITLETVGGNHVVLDIGGGKYAFYAHVKPGSLRVKLGDRVKRGQVLGLVGNSGNSTEPHLHFHVADSQAAGTSTLGAEGLPYAMTSFQVVGKCALSPAGLTCTRHAPVTVRGGIPLENQIVVFPR